jgi:3-methylcrotonyl-CoA carboxylase alpha subunit
VPFTRLLIANRGEIAIRITRACRELGIAAIAVYTEADAGALHVREADEAVPLPGGPRAYLDIAAVVAAARASGAQAIHPGYGFLSERPEFARACREAGLAFVGPPPEAIALMGSKIAAKRLAESLNVPTAPGYAGDDQTPARLRQEAARVGFPLLIKASAGGGGKGMRTVGGPEELDAALEGAKREALAAFGDDSVFLERLIVRPRHVEIQVLADAHGHCVHLFERECSIQRRHQKIIEESPSVALTPELRARMGAAAVRLAQAAGYVNAGTMEFMLDEAGGFYFLEMNTRLQVEHPVTEAVTGLDLVRLQLAVAAGEPLPFRQDDLLQRGHAIEARVYAEDPATFLPSTGQVALFAPAEGPGVRNDAGVASGDAITVHYDPMVAKLIVHAPDRPAALARLRRALDEYVVLGVTTNLPLLRAVAAHPAFAAGETRTDFLEATGLLGAGFEPAEVPAEVLAAAAIWDVGRRAADGERPFADPWAAGAWRAGGAPRRVRYRVAGREQAVELSRIDQRWRVRAGETELTAEVISRQPDASVLALAFTPTPRATPRPNGGGGDGTITSTATHPASIQRFAITGESGALLVGWRGASYRLERDAGLSLETRGRQAGAAGGHAGLEAPMPGTVVKVLAGEGERVVAHQPLVVLEAMKMEHIVAAPYAGVVRKLHCAPGALVARGALLVELEAGAEP